MSDVDGKSYLSCMGMRLTTEEIMTLKQTLKRLSPAARLYLFGSRTDDRMRGGDIDLLVVSDTLTKRDLRKLRIEFCQRFGEQKIDILLDDGQFTPLFHQIARQQAIEL